MLLPTHLVGGQVFFLGGCIIAGHAPSPAEALVAVLSSALPDLDKRSGLVGRWVPFLSSALEYRFGHRTLTHSLLLQTGVALLAWWLLPAGYGLALCLGLVSHAFLDMLTPAGVAWLWPSPVRCVLPGNPRYRAESMGKGELGVLCVLVVLAFPLQRLAQAGQDLSGLIRSAIGDLAAARKQYEVEKGSNAFRLVIKGRGNQSLGAIAGEFPVIGGFQEGGFLLDTPEGVKTLCQASGCDWHPEHTVLVKGEPQQTTSFSFQTKTLSIEQLRAALLPYAGWETYLLGEARSPKPIERPPLITTHGERVRFDHARLSEIEGLDGALREVAISVQVRHGPGVSLPPLVIGEPDVAKIDELSRWVEGLLARFASP